jgi:hypothetical protein
MFYEKEILHVYGYIRELELMWVRKVKKVGVNILFYNV